MLAKNIGGLTRCIIVCVKMVNLGESREFTRETHAKRDECQSLTQEVFPALTAHFACNNWKACSQAQGAMSQRVSSSFYNANDARTVAICNNHRTL